MQDPASQAPRGTPSFPDPSLSTAIPSIHDGTAIDCRVYHPSCLAGSRRARHAAILAHPYAPMGGCFDDPVVLAVGRQLLQRGYIVGTFNFRRGPGKRGAGCSAGRTSWTARPEQDDYASFVGFMMYYIHYLEEQLEASQQHGDAPSRPLLLMGGYSFGAMVTAQMAPLGDLFEAFRCPRQGTYADEIRLRAKASAEHATSAPPPRPADGDGTGSGLMMMPSPAYLLISPPAPGGLVARLTTLSLVRGAEGLRATAAEGKLVRDRTLAVYGDGDALVSVGRLRAWAGTLRGRRGSRFRFEEVRAAGHFWSEQGVLRHLVRAVDDFAHGLQEGQG